MKNLSSRLTRATPLKIARGVYRRARHGLSGIGQLDGSSGSLTKLSPYVEQLRRIAQEMVGATAQQPGCFILATAEQVNSGPAARPIVLPDYSDLRVRLIPAAPASIEE